MFLNIASTKIKRLNIIESDKKITLEINAIKILYDNGIGFWLNVMDLNSTNVICTYGYNLKWIDVSKDEIVMEFDVDGAISKIYLLDDFILLQSEISIYKVDKAKAKLLDKYKFHDVITDIKFNTGSAKIEIWDGSVWLLDLKNFKGEQITF